MLRQRPAERRDGGLEGVLDDGRDPFEGPLTEEFRELCLDAVFTPEAVILMRK